MENDKLSWWPLCTDEAPHREIPPLSAGRGALEENVGVVKHNPLVGAVLRSIVIQLRRLILGWLTTQTPRD